MQQAILDEFKSSIIDNVIKNTILNNPNAFRHILGDGNLDINILSEFNDISMKNVFFNTNIPANISHDKKFLYLLLFQSIRICALLHDIGHPPFSHITEAVIEKVYSDIKGKDKKTPREDEFISIISNYEQKYKNPQLHEKMGQQMMEAIFDGLVDKDNNNGLYRGLSFEEKYFKILLFETVKSIFAEKSNIFRDLHAIVDGVLDGDRLDYVCRDVINSGINNGLIEYDRLISSMKITKIENRYFFITDAKTVNTVEDFLIKRFNLYKNIIYHHRVIKTDTLLKNCLENIMKEYLSKDVPIEKGTTVIPYNISGLWIAIKFATSNTKFFNSLIQWDDDWINTILKKIYFEEYYNTDHIIKYQLEELLSNEKNYFSIIKNNSDFEVLSEHINGNIKKLYENEKFKFIDEKLKNRCVKASLFYSIRDYYVATDSTFNFNKFIEDKLSEFINIKADYKDKIKHFIIEFKAIKTGLNTEPYLHKEKGHIRISEISNIKDMLSSESLLFPFFHIYLNIKDNNYYFDRQSFLKEFGEFLAKEIIDNIVI